jgi:hypothetical protein
MKFRFQALPSERFTRPVVPVTFSALPGFATVGLVDSGARGTRIGSEWADLLGLDLSEADHNRIRVGGGAYDARDISVRMKVGRWEWDAEVSFVENWDKGFALLGIKGFFDNFVVRIDAARQETSLTRRPYKGS